jgi:hypothetical protein
LQQLLGKFNERDPATGVEALPPWNRDAGGMDGYMPMLVRDAYKKMTKLLQDDKNLERAVVTGMPGIGKSWFVDYFALACIQRGHAVILECDVGVTARSLRRVELLVPQVGENGVITGLEHAWQIETDTGIEISVHFDAIKRLIGDRGCWNLIDYRDKDWKPIFGDLLRAKRVFFVSPDRQRWAGFFVSDHDKGQEPTFQMPVWDMVELEDLRLLFHARGTNRITSDDLDVLVSLFGPSPRYCLTQFQLKAGPPNTDGKGDTVEIVDYDKNDAVEKQEEEDAIARVQQHPEDEESANALSNQVCSSSEMLKAALSKLSAGLRIPVMRAADIIKGRVFTPGVVRELEGIRESPSGSTCSSSVSSRLLVWGVKGGEFLSTSKHPSYAHYASPFIALIVMEENSKEALRSIAKFFADGDRNVGSGSGWMYENFILKFWLPILRPKQEFKIIVIGEGESMEQFTIPGNYHCEAFGSLKDVAFKDGTMYLPVSRTLGAVDCFLVVGKCLVLFQVTSGAEHSIVKQKMDELVNLAKQEGGIETVWFVFVVPHWRADTYSKKGQNMTTQGKVIRLTGPFKKDVKATLSAAIEALEQNAIDVSKLQLLFSANTGAATKDLRKKLQLILANELRSQKGFQDSELEKWSVPRLLANYESTEKIDSAVKQLLWPIQKSDYDDYFKQYNLSADHVDRKAETGHADGEAES